MLLALLFIVGTLNFTAHKAVLESGHPILETLPRTLRDGGGRLSLGFEFLVLLGAMLFAAHGWPAAAWAYGLYSALNCLLAWLVITRRM